MTTDPHGQPLNLRFNRARRAERDLSEMLGLVKGVPLLISTCGMLFFSVLSVRRSWGLLPFSFTSAWWLPPLYCPPDWR